LRHLILAVQTAYWLTVVKSLSSRATLAKVVYLFWSVEGEVPFVQAEEVFWHS
jgi:hypothetical protein